MKVIINADDFGYNSVINHSIEVAIKSQKISSSTIMANAPAFDEAVTIAKQYSHISYGVHLNIIEFKPLTDAELFHHYKLTDDNGCFIEGAALGLPEYPEELKDAIKREWRTQINKVKQSGINISHFDSHQHTHAINALQDVMIDLMKEFGVHRLRRQGYSSIARMLRERNYSHPRYDKSNAVPPPKRSLPYRILNHILLLPLSHRKWVNGMKDIAVMTDELMSYQTFVQDIKFQRSRLKYKTIELECHPGLMPNMEETNMLMRDELRNKVNYELINYWQL